MIRGMKMYLWTMLLVAAGALFGCSDPYSPTAPASGGDSTGTVVTHQPPQHFTEDRSITSVAILNGDSVTGDTLTFQVTVGLPDSNDTRYVVTFGPCIGHTFVRGYIDADSTMGLNDEIIGTACSDTSSTTYLQNGHTLSDGQLLTPDSNGNVTFQWVLGSGAWTSDSMSRHATLVWGWYEVKNTVSGDSLVSANNQVDGLEQRIIR